MGTQRFEPIRSWQSTSLAISTSFLQTTSLQAGAVASQLSGPSVSESSSAAAQDWFKLSSNTSVSSGTERQHKIVSCCAFLSCFSCPTLQFAFQPPPSRAYILQTMRQRWDEAEK